MQIGFDFFRPMGNPRSPMAKQALGKGLGALIKKQPGSPASVTLESDGRRVRDVPTDKIVASPLQPRVHFVDTPLDELVDSIRQHGIIQPLIVRAVGDTLELIAGERRWRAAMKLDLATVPVIEREATDREVLEMALVENLQREDLNPMEEAAGYVRLAKEFSLKQEEIAGRVGKSRASVANAMRLLDLHPDVQMLVAQKKLSVGHAKAILAIKDHDAQRVLAEQVIRKQLTVRATEKHAQSHIVPGSHPSDPATGKQHLDHGLDPHISALTSRLRDHFATHVMIHHSQKKGRIELEYYGNDDLQRILELLGLGEDA